MLCLKCGKKILDDAILCNYCVTKYDTNEPLDDKGNTPLILAAMSGKIDTVKLLISEKVNLNAKNASGKTALMRASYYGHINVVKRLIVAGADIDAKCDLDNTALIYATAKGHTEIVDSLIEAGANVNEKTRIGFTALMCACQKGHVEITKLLIDNGVDVNARNDASKLVDKSKNHSGDKNSDSSLYNNDYSSGNTALMSAAKRGYRDIVRLLITSGANVNIKDHNGYTALMHATTARHDQVIRLLEAAEDSRSQRLTTMFVAVAIICVVSFIVRDPFGFRGDKGTSINTQVEQIEVDATDETENLFEEIEVDATDETENLFEEIEANTTDETENLFEEIEANTTD